MSLGGHNDDVLTSGSRIRSNVLQLEEMEVLRIGVGIRVEGS